MDSRQWNRVLWSDESSFQLFATPGNVRVRKRPGEVWNKDCIIPTVKHGSGLLWSGGACQVLKLEG